MFTVDVIVKYTPIPLSVERKSLEDAEAVYQMVLKAAQTHEPPIVELTCEKMTDKKVAILSQEISAVQVSQKSGATATGRAPGFVALTQ